MSAAITSHSRTMQLRAGGKKLTVARPPPPTAFSTGSGRVACELSATSEFPELVMLSSVMAPSARPVCFGRWFTSFGLMCP